MGKRTVGYAAPPLLLLLLLSCTQEDTIGVGPSVGDGGIEATDVAVGTFDGTTEDCDFTCSEDRHNVLCNGKVRQTCSGDQACVRGVCTTACDIATVDESSVGCDFYTFAPFAFQTGNCFAAFVANTWSSPAEITVEYQDKTFDASKFAYVPSGSGLDITYTPLEGGTLDPGQVAILFLSGNPTYVPYCPAGTHAALEEDPAPTGTGITSAFHIHTSVPVAAYDIYPYGGGSSMMTAASLLLPTSAWGTNYMGVTAYPASSFFDQYRTSLSVVAPQGGTDVTLRPGVDVVGGGGVAPTSAGTPMTVHLNGGDVLQLVQTQELIGSPIESTAPVAVFGGSGCINVPHGVDACDSAHQQIPPIKALGSHYAAVRYRDRYEDSPESPPWRLVGIVDGTKLSYVPAAPAGASATLNAGEVVEFEEGEPFIVRSQDDDHPFYMAGYMTGCWSHATDQDDCRGDPEFVNVTPTKQYLSSYTFFTDPTYPETDLVLIRAKGDDGFADVTLDCAGVLSGWAPLGSDYEWTRFDVSRGNFEGQGGCNNGRHTITSSKPFGLTVWGWGSFASGWGPTGGFESRWVSYAYPAGVSIRKLSDVYVPVIPK